MARRRFTFATEGVGPAGVAHILNLPAVIVDGDGALP